MVPMVLLLAYNHNVISNDNHLFNHSKALIKLVLEYIPSNSSTKWYNSVPKLPISVLKVVKSDEASSRHLQANGQSP